MIVVAVLLLPMAVLLLYVMDRLEEQLFSKPLKGRHARGHRLRLIHSASQPSAERRIAGRHVDAA
ncbi:hypothetical protein ACFVY1_42770 [Streptomyces sp. NPDC058293]|uniref:hypothetical protein n=1 Tax=unclassified Streptomyces TaxID=2593676 RepID=UPI0033A35838